jgi:hypothetical protein
LVEELRFCPSCGAALAPPPGAKEGEPPQKATIPLTVSAVQGILAERKRPDAERGPSEVAPSEVSSGEALDRVVAPSEVASGEASDEEGGPLPAEALGKGMTLPMEALDGESTQQVQALHRPAASQAGGASKQTLVFSTQNTHLPAFGADPHAGLPFTASETPSGTARKLERHPKNAMLLKVGDTFAVPSEADEAALNDTRPMLSTTRPMDELAPALKGSAPIRTGPPPAKEFSLKVPLTKALQGSVPIRTGPPGKHPDPQAPSVNVSSRYADALEQEQERITQADSREVVSLSARPTVALVPPTLVVNRDELARKTAVLVRGAIPPATPKPPKSLWVVALGLVLWVLLAAAVMALLLLDMGMDHMEQMKP